MRQRIRKLSELGEAYGLDSWRVDIFERMGINDTKEFYDRYYQSEEEKKKIERILCDFDHQDKYIKRILAEYSPIPFVVKLLPLSRRGKIRTILTTILLIAGIVIGIPAVIEIFYGRNLPVRDYICEVWWDDSKWDNRIYEVPEKTSLIFGASGYVWERTEFWVQPGYPYKPPIKDIVREGSYTVTSNNQLAIAWDEDKRGDWDRDDIMSAAIYEVYIKDFDHHRTLRLRRLGKEKWEYFISRKDNKYRKDE